MKSPNLIALAIAAGSAMQRAYRLWEAQGGIAASLRGKAGPTRLADLALDLARQRSMESEWFWALNALFPLGYGHRNRWRSTAR